MCVIETLTDQIFVDSSGKKTVRQRYRTKRGKERYRYIALLPCAYCGADFVPTRRGVHKYCSSSCRSRACKERNHYAQPGSLPAESAVKFDLVPIEQAPKEQFSWLRTGENALAAGTVAAVQYAAIENMIAKQMDILKQEIKLSEQRTAKNVMTIVDHKLKGFTAPPRASRSIDAQAFKNAEDMLF